MYLLTEEKKIYFIFIFYISLRNLFFNHIEYTLEFSQNVKNITCIGTLYLMMLIIIDLVSNILKKIML